MGTQGLVVEHEGRTAVLTLNRPARLNALDVTLAGQLRSALEAAADDPAVRTVVIRGAGGNFCAGADIHELSSINSPEEWRRSLVAYRQMYEAITKRSIPTIAQISGYAVAGGLELALACDFAYADTTARLGDLHARRALIPGGGATWLLPRVVGPRRAKELLLLGDVWTAETALEHGLVNGVTEPSALDQTVMAVARRLADVSGTATAATSRLADHAYDLDCAAARDAEIAASVEHFRHPDFRHGVATFLLDGAIGDSNRDGVPPDRTADLNRN